MIRRRLLLVIGLATATMLAGAAALPGVHAADPDGLWHLVHDYCVPNQQQSGKPAPCALVDLHGGAAAGFVVLKDLIGTTQYLVIPTAKVTGIEDPQLLAQGAPNYFADAWQERGYTEQAAGHKLPRDALSLAVNSVFARSQNQLHIHVDCLRPAVRTELLRELPAIGDRWAPLAAPLSGHSYWAMRVMGADLGGADPIKLLADTKPGARSTMGGQTLVVAGAVFAGGQPGFVLLNDRRDPATGDRAGGEELQDHSCALARQ